MLVNGDPRVGAGADEPLRETLPGDQPVRITQSNDRCREPSIVPDRLRLIQRDAPKVGHVYSLGGVGVGVAVAVGVGVEVAVAVAVFSGSCWEGETDCCRACSW